MNLPVPDPAFHWTSETSGPVLRCIPLEAIAQHAFTSRQPRLADDSVDASNEAWLLGARAVGASPARVMRVKQVHGNVVRVLRRGAMTEDAARQRPDGDAIVSNQSGLALSVSVADCVPILIADARRGAAAAIHAGWRGSCARIVSAAVETMTREFGTDADDCVAAIGPSIGPTDYEVGAELRDAFLAAGHPPERVDRYFRPSGSKFLLDLWLANRDQLLAAGVRTANTFVCGLSTLTYREVFESYRADHVRAGRMAAIVVVPGPYPDPV